MNGTRATAFGRPVSDGIATAVLNDPSLNANPSPQQPAEFPANDLARAYALLLYAVQELQTKEHDPMALTELQDCRRFADGRLNKILQNSGMQGPPAASMSPTTPQDQAGALLPPPPPTGAAPAAAAPDASGAPPPQ